MNETINDYNKIQKFPSLKIKFRDSGLSVDKFRECDFKGITSGALREKSVTLSVYEKTRGIALPYYNLLRLSQSYVFQGIYVASLSHYLNLEKFLRADYQVAKIDAKSDDEISLGGNGRSALTNTNIGEFSK